ncbi:response regulator [Kineococcus terrestris]|uniref:response regulator n=1 Tax=Kineococcus terrestris TaxID=2044856 RepID=UPI0034DB0DD3
MPEDEDEGAALPRVLVVDDHPLFRDGVAALLTSTGAVTVVGTAADGEQALAAVAQHDPDVVLMDVQMPVLDGVAATRRLVDSGARSAVVVLTMSEEDATVFAAVRAGARGYLLKGAGQEELIAAVRTAATGGAVFGAALAARMAAFFSAPPSPPSAAAAFPGLTAREAEVLEQLAAGRTNAEIAGRLFLSPKTVRNVVSAVLAKLQAADRTEAAARAREAGVAPTA